MDIAPGSNLDEVRLSQNYKLSRTPLREILQRLAGDGYVELTSNKGARVTSMDLSAMRIFFQTAPLIYCNIARLAAENRTPDQLSRLKTIQRQFRLAFEGANATGMSLLNHEFHQITGEMAANTYLMPSLEHLLIDHTRLAQIFYRPKDPQEKDIVKKACDQHDAMIDAIERQHVEDAVDLTLKHWDLSRHRMDRFIRPDPLSADIADFRETENAD